MGPWRYIALSIGAAVATAAAIGGFNIAVDPLGYFGRNPFGLYHQDGLPVFKTAMLRGRGYDAVLLGSSNSDGIGAAETRPFGLRLFNASLLGILPEDMLYYARHVLAAERTLIVAFDFYMANEGCKPLRDSEFRAREWRNWPTYALSPKVTYYSLRTLRWYLKGTPPLNFASGDADRERREAENARATAYDYGNWVEQTRALFYCDFRYSERRMAMIRELVAELDARGVRLAGYLSPMHQEIVAMFRREGIYDDFLRWRREMAAIVPGLADFSEGPFSRPQDFYWDDPLHYTRKAAAEIMRRLLGAGR